MPMREYLEWQEFYGLEPFGLQVSDAMHAHQIAMLANVNRNAEKRPEPFEIKDFLLFPPDKPQESIEKEQAPTVDGMTAEEWKLLFSFQALQRRRDHAKKLEDENKGVPGDRGDGSGGNGAAGGSGETGVAVG